MKELSMRETEVLFVVLVHIMVSDFVALLTIPFDIPFPVILVFFVGSSCLMGYLVERLLQKAKEERKGRA
jgi:hypothetical protein